MSATPLPRGGAPVGYLSELGDVEVGAVICLRLWCGGAEGQGQVMTDLQDALGKVRGRAAFECFDALCDMCMTHGRRPLMRHHLACKCLGADESCFANVIGYASEGAQEDAQMLASTMVRPDMAATLAHLARDFGLALRCAAARHGGHAHHGTGTTHEAPATLH